MRPKSESWGCSGSGASSLHSQPVFAHVLQAEILKAGVPLTQGLAEVERKYLEALYSHKASVILAQRGSSQLIESKLFDYNTTFRALGGTPVLYDRCEPEVFYCPQALKQKIQISLTLACYVVSRVSGEDLGRSDFPSPVLHENLRLVTFDKWVWCFLPHLNCPPLPRCPDYDKDAEHDADATIVTTTVLHPARGSSEVDVKPRPFSALFAPRSFSTMFVSHVMMTIVTVNGARDSVSVRSPIFVQTETCSYLEIWLLSQHSMWYVPALRILTADVGYTMIDDAENYENGETDTARCSSDYTAKRSV
ncbi:hypothetical protein BaRGS_00009892 [Batillaria attramentaria]|uniref:Uncharacterized protein n=1 Tax=Batillaria attramentaria TaxID=370345 RepID=A0ABD0LH74_9CAEN